MAQHPSPAAIRKDEASMRKWFAEVSVAAAAFERRWTMLSLGRVDALLASRLREQRNLFDQAMATGTASDIETHGPAMCRGYAVACGAMARAEAPDDACMLGSDPVTGLAVAIGTQKAAANLHPGAIWITPDEVAALIAASANAAGFICTVKRLFPGAVLVPDGGT